MSALPAMTIGPVGIRQDEYGRFNLNDLHEASGGQLVDRPNFFLKLDKTQALIRRLSERADPNARNPAIKPVESKRGRYGGTFAARQMVIAYAMWISTDFYLQVIEVFDGVQRLRKGLGESRHVLDIESAVGHKLAVRGASDMGRWSWQSRRLQAQYARIDNVLQMSLFQDEVRP